jgi:cobalt/nickel transport system permease protein
MLLVRLTPPIGVVGIIFIIQIFFYGKTPLFEFTLAGIHLIGYKEGLSQAVLIGSKILASVSLVLFLTMTTSMPKLIFTASWFRIPHTFVEITMFTYRYIFLFLRSAFIIRDAQMVRLGYANFKAALKSWANLAGSMIIKAYNQTLSTYEAMTCRGYTGKITLKEEIKFNLKETLVIFSIVVILIFMYLFCQDMAILR